MAPIFVSNSNYVKRLLIKHSIYQLKPLSFQRPSPALHDLPSPDLTSTNPIVKRQPQQKFFPKGAKTDQRENNNGFMNDPVPFTSSIASLHNGSSRPERSEGKSQVWDSLKLIPGRDSPPKKGYFWWRIPSRYCYCFFSIQFATECYHVFINFSGPGGL